MIIMLYNRKLAMEICEEMGIEWDINADCITVGGKSEGQEDMLYRADEEFIRENYVDFNDNDFCIEIYSESNIISDLTYENSVYNDIRMNDILAA